MSLAAGARLGPYEVVSSIGAGGTYSADDLIRSKPRAE